MTGIARMQIEQIYDKHGLNRFIKLPWAVYEGDKNWVPPLVSELTFVLSERNPFFNHAEAAYFIARQNGTDVGRIAAIIDRNYINFHKEQTGFFGYFECMPDFHIAERLIDAASAWLRERGIEIMRGPMNPSTNDECGFLVEGHDSPPMIMMPYTPYRYLDYMTDCGLNKAKDLYAYITNVDEVTAAGRLERLAGGVLNRMPELSVRQANMNRFEHELEVVKDIYNSAWTHNWGFVPMTDKEIESMAKRLKPLLIPELLLIAEVNGDPAAFFMAVPDYNQVLKKINGKLWPIGILKFLWYSRKITDLRVLTLGVKEQYRKKGIEGLLYLEAFRAARKRGYKRAEMSWILEDNILTQRAAEMMGGKLYKKYRIYEKNLN